MVPSDSSANPTTCPPTLCRSAAVRWRARLSDPSQPSPWLHEEVARRMVERLDLIKLQPQTWAHWEPVLSGRQTHAALVARWPDAKDLWVTDFHQNTGLVADSIGLSAIKNDVLTGSATIQSSWSQRLKQQLSGFIAAKPKSPTALSPSRVDAGQVQLLWSNMLLHGVDEPGALIQAWYRALAVNGCLMFSALGVDTGHELRRLHQGSGFGPAAAQLTDMHDWGDMLIGAGFAEPVMDMEHLTLTYPNAKALLADWRSFGQNGHVARFAGLRTPRWQAQLETAIEHQFRQASGELAMTVEIIYGHAFKPPPKAKMSEHSAISMQEMRAMLAQPKTRR